jgi:hypothetical protein
LSGRSRTFTIASNSPSVRNDYSVIQAHFSPKPEEAGAETEEFHELGRNL